MATQTAAERLVDPISSLKTVRATLGFQLWAYLAGELDALPPLGDGAQAVRDVPEGLPVFPALLQACGCSAQPAVSARGLWSSS